MLQDEKVPETELFGDDVVICETFDDDKIRGTLGDVDATDLEATQPPILSRYNRWILYRRPTMTPSLGSSLQKQPSVASGAEGADDLITPSQLIEEFSTEYVDDLHVAVGAEGHTLSHSLERVSVVDPHHALHSSPKVRSETRQVSMGMRSEQVNVDDREIAHAGGAVLAMSEKVNTGVCKIAPVSAPVLAAANELVSVAPRPVVPCSTVSGGTSSIGAYAAIDNVAIDDAASSGGVEQVSERPGRQAIQTTHSAQRPAAPAEPSLGTQPRHMPISRSLAKRPEEPVPPPDEPTGGQVCQQQLRQHSKSTSSSGSSTTNGMMNECYLLSGSQTAGPDRDYPAPGQQLPPTPLQPTQKADVFGAELDLLYRQQAAQLRRPTSATTVPWIAAPTFTYPRHLRQELLQAGRPPAEHRSQHSTARSQRTSTTICDARHLHRSYIAPPRHTRIPVRRSVLPHLCLSPRLCVLIGQVDQLRVMGHDLSAEVFSVVRQVTDALLQVTHQTCDDAVARERLLLQQQQLLQRDFIDKEIKDRELLWAEKQKLIEKELKEKQILADKEIKEKQMIAEREKLQFEREQRAVEAVERERQLQLEREKMQLEREE